MVHSLTALVPRQETEAAKRKQEQRCLLIFDGLFLPTQETQQQNALTLIHIIVIDLHFSSLFLAMHACSVSPWQRPLHMETKAREEGNKEMQFISDRRNVKCTRDYDSTNFTREMRREESHRLTSVELSTNCIEWKMVLQNTCTIKSGWLRSARDLAGPVQWSHAAGREEGEKAHYDGCEEEKKRKKAEAQGETWTHLQCSSRIILSFFGFFDFTWHFVLILLARLSQELKIVTASSERVRHFLLPLHASETRERVEWDGQNSLQKVHESTRVSRGNRKRSLSSNFSIDAVTSSRVSECEKWQVKRRLAECYAGAERERDRQWVFVLDEQARRVNVLHVYWWRWIF